MSDVVDYVDKIIFSHKSIGTWRTERMPRQAQLDAPGTEDPLVCEG